MHDNWTQWVTRVRRGRGEVRLGNTAEQQHEKPGTRVSREYEAEYKGN